MDSLNGQSNVWPPLAKPPLPHGTPLAWQDQAADVPRPRPSREKSPCNPRGKRHYDRGQVGEAAILPDGCLQHPEQVQEARQWLVRVLARRGVEILQAQQKGGLR